VALQDLEYLISEAVNPEIADYAIVTGVQIHNWGESFDNEEPTLEFVAPTRVSVVINGERTELDLSQIPVSSHHLHVFFVKSVLQARMLTMCTPPCSLPPPGSFASWLACPLGTQPAGEDANLPL